ncbi:MAG: hypothetical protein BGO86_03635 [Chryseobacterium sp. 36-9]|nr:MAG: hypothetical protein BGO86_03635 [Chryseobacterium sp. 36-9]
MLNIFVQFNAIYGKFKNYNDMIWIILIVILAIVFISRTNKETKQIEKVPFIDKYSIIITGLNLKLFQGDADYEFKDSREHYLVKNTFSRQSFVQFINRENTLYLKYEEYFMEIKTTFSYNYSGVKDITDEQQEFIVNDFYSRVKEQSKVSF